jgi:hypothetical protein
VLVQEGRYIGVFVGFAIHDVAPVAPHGPYVEQDRLVGFLSGCEGFVAPGIPVNGLMRGRLEVRRRGRGKSIGRHGRESTRLRLAMSVIFDRGPGIMCR